jgi:hypothetical protein
MALACWVLASQSLLLGLGAEPLLQLGAAAAHQLLEPGEYVQAILREG